MNSAPAKAGGARPGAGRPATGRKRNRRLSLLLTEDEEREVKGLPLDDETLTDAILRAVRAARAAGALQ